MKKFNEKLAYDGYLKIKTAEIQFDNSEEKFEFSKLEKNNAVAILVFNEETQKFIVVRQYRYPIDSVENEFVIEIPAGTMDGKESPKQTAIRELEEEIGYKTEDIEQIMEYYPSVGYSTEKVHLFMAIVNNSQKINNGGGLKNEGEFIEVLEVNVSELYSLLEAGLIKDAKTIMAVQEFKIKHLNDLISQEVENTNKVVETAQKQQKRIEDLETKIMILTNSPKKEA